jgi:hypothetical protein
MISKRFPVRITCQPWSTAYQPSPLRTTYTACHADASQVVHSPQPEPQLPADIVSAEVVSNWGVGWPTKLLLYVMNTAGGGGSRATPPSSKSSQQSIQHQQHAPNSAAPSSTGTQRGLHTPMEVPCHGVRNMPPKKETEATAQATAIAQHHRHPHRRLQHSRIFVPGVPGTDLNCGCIDPLPVPSHRSWAVGWHFSQQPAPCDAVLGACSWKCPGPSPSLRLHAKDMHAEWLKSEGCSA